MIVNALVALCAAGLSAMCMVLVLHPDYEDGLLGRAALSFMGISAFGRAITLAESGFTLNLSWIAVMIWLSVTLFVARHLYRFLRWRRCGENDWRVGTNASTGGKLLEQTMGRETEGSNEPHRVF